jgi:hypothetical protein
MGIKLHREKYSDDFLPYNLPELFQGCEKLEKIAKARTNVLSHAPMTKIAKHKATETQMQLFIFSGNQPVLHKISYNLSYSKRYRKL